VRRAAAATVAPVIVLVLVLVLAAPAAAHGPTATQAGYVSNVNAVLPNVLGLSANVVGGDVFLRLSNYSGKRIVILGYQGEPYLRFENSAVWENARSPAAYVNRFRGMHASLPPSASPSAAPVWRKVAEGASYKWRDHRIYWVRREPPPGVKAHPERIQRVFAWRVPGRADGQRFAITGILGYAPALGGDGGGRDWELPALGGWAALVALVSVGLWVAHRRERRATRP
jgi:hypothetical protein